MTFPGNVPREKCWKCCELRRRRSSKRKRSRAPSRKQKARKEGGAKHHYTRHHDQRRGTERGSLHPTQVVSDRQRRDGRAGRRGAGATEPAPSLSPPPPFPKRAFRLDGSSRRAGERERVQGVGGTGCERAARSPSPSACRRSRAVRAPGCFFSRLLRFSLTRVFPLLEKKLLEQPLDRSQGPLGHPDQRRALG